MRKTAIWAAGLLMSGMLAAPAFAQSDYQVSRKEVRETSEAPTVNQLTAVDDARIAKAKADLRLTPDQEGQWSKLERALKDISKRRADQTIARWKEDHDARDKGDKARDQRAEPVTPINRMRLAADGMNVQAADLKTIADASEPLYNKLDDSQRRTIELVLREQLSRPVAFEEGRRSRRSSDW